MKKGETKTYSFTAKWKENVHHYGPLVFIAPNGNWSKATHKLFCGEIHWAMSAEDAARQKAADEAATARRKPPEGITYKKSWLVPRGCFKPGTDEPMKEVHEGESFVLWQRFGKLLALQRQVRRRGPPGRKAHRVVVRLTR